jgi:uncharacterized membrane-anchored protein YitT (DUF2179 family)
MLSFSKTAPWIVITFGSLLASAGYVFLIFPLHLFEGGITGVGLIANKISGLPIGVTSLAITFAIYLAGIRIIGKNFGVKAFYATSIVYLSIDIFSLFKPPPLTNDLLLASFYGALLTGTGMGLIFFNGSATGGSDAIAQILKKLYNIPIGRSLIAIDFLVLSCAAFLVGIEKIMYSFLFIFVQIKVMDTILNGLEIDQKITIITKEPERIKVALHSKKYKYIIYSSDAAFSEVIKYSIVVVVPKKYIPVVKKTISEIDVEVFVFVEDVYQVYNQSFSLKK